MLIDKYSPQAQESISSLAGRGTTTLFVVPACQAT
jgi:hypothetical protein